MALYGYMCVNVSLSMVMYGRMCILWSYGCMYGRMYRHVCILWSYGSMYGHVSMVIW